MKKPEYTQPFNLDHARAGAPYGCENGYKAEIIRWDMRGGNCHLLGVITSGEVDSSIRWNEAGLPPASYVPSYTLVMLPLGYIDGKPVFWDSQLEHKDGTPVHGHVAAHHGMDNYRWPAPAVKSSLGDEELHRLQRAENGVTGGLRAVAEAAIARHIQDNAKPAEAKITAADIVREGINMPSQTLRIRYPDCYLDTAPQAVNVKAPGETPPVQDTAELLRQVLVKHGFVFSPILGWKPPVEWQADREKRDMAVAEAVKREIINAWGRADRARELNDMTGVDLAAIIAGVPK